MNNSLLKSSFTPSPSYHRNWIIDLNPKDLYWSQEVRISLTLWHSLNKIRFYAISKVISAGVRKRSDSLPQHGKFIEVSEFQYPTIV